MITVIRVEREIDGVLMNVELAKDLDDPERNRFEFEDEKYCWIIRALKPKEEPTPQPEISERELVLKLRSRRS